MTLPRVTAFTDGLKWRCIGLSRGGRVVAVAGDPDDPMVFYFGGCAGGVWKTADGGVYWRCMTDGYFGSAAVGALAVARSDRNVIYAGSALSRMLHRMGLSWQTTRPAHPKDDAEAQELYKKLGRHSEIAPRFARARGGRRRPPRQDAAAVV